MIPLNDLIINKIENKRYNNSLNYTTLTQKIFNNRYMSKLFLFKTYLKF